MIEINNLTKRQVNEEKLKKLAEKILQFENKRGNISIAFVGERRIKYLNEKYRGKAKATDVLSFSFNDNFNVWQEPIIGELIICLNIIRKNAIQDKVSFAVELEKVLIHGLLHLLGYNHEKGGKEREEMERKEKYYWQKLAGTR